MASEQPNDGGAAFPGGLYEHQHAGSNDREPYNHGMTLRDWFAGQALVALFAGEANPSVGVNVEPYSHDKHRHQMAGMAYGLADAMLTARNEQPTA